MIKSFIVVLFIDQCFTFLWCQKDFNFFKMNLVREASCCKLPSSNLIYYTRPADMMHKVACYHCMHVTALLSVMVVGQDQTSVAHPMYYIRSHLTKSRVSDPLCFSQTIDWISRVWHGKKPWLVCDAIPMSI